jgi:hypothetical protein
LVAAASEPSSPILPGPATSSTACRAELWRQAKKKRADEWAAFHASKPDEQYEAPADVAALAEAAATIGDFKLKSDTSHVPPEVCSAVQMHMPQLCQQGLHGADLGVKWL